jgi:hypothetical protein
VFALIHSPIVGPLTWALVAEELERRGEKALVPALANGEEEEPYWKQHAESLAEFFGGLVAERQVLVAHSGAGPILPALAQQIGKPAAYIFVDASLPEDEASRLDQLAAELPEAATALERMLAAGQRAPDWSDSDLRHEIPDARLRRRVLAELTPRPARFYEEPIAVFEGWPDAPCGYLQFSPAYERPGAQARERGWAYRRLEGVIFTCWSIHPPLPAPSLRLSRPLRAEAHRAALR